MRRSREPCEADPAPGRPAARAPAANLAQEFIGALLTHVGIDPRRYRAAPLDRRLPACLRALGARSPDHARSILENDPARIDTALDAVLLGVTEFFRDPAVFDELRAILPVLVQANPALRIWSAGCSDGQELYSVAMLLAGMGLLDRCELLGTDCRASAIARASAGSYPRPAAAGVPKDCRHFIETAGGQAVVCREIRDRIGWRAMNLFDEMPAGPWDIILWRNMAIYLEASVGGETWGRLTEALRPGGILVVGRAEKPPREMALERMAASIYRKLGE